MRNIHSRFVRQRWMYFFRFSGKAAKDIVRILINVQPVAFCISLESVKIAVFKNTFCIWDHIFYWLDPIGFYLA